MNLIVFVLCGVVVVAVGYFVSRMVAGPIQTISDYVKAVNRSGDFSQSLSIDSQDDVGEMASSLTELIGSVNDAIHETNGVLDGVSIGDFSRSVEGDYPGDIGCLGEGVNQAVGRIRDAQDKQKEQAVALEKSLASSQAIAKQAEEDAAKYASVKNVGLQHFYGMISNIDDNVGALRAFLKEEGLADNTIFIFTTDNGSSSGWKTFNADMRAGKGSEYDGGHRVPFFVYWPEGGLTGGRDVEPITAHVDILPTLIDLCRIAAPTGVKFDGTTLTPLLHSKAVDWPDRVLVTDSQRVKDPSRVRKSSVMTSQGRLINGKELYDIKSDPGQKTDVASGHPAVVQRLTKFYEDWWADLLPTFSNATAIYLGHPQDNPARLTSHDWITTGSTPWNQSHIRKAQNGKSATGFWNVYVHETGDYEVRLRRWPESADLPIDAALPPGDPVPGSKAFRMTPGKAISPSRATLKIGELSAEAPVKAGDKEVVFNVRLVQGKTRMAALFIADDGEQHGAYYAYVTKK